MRLTIGFAALALALSGGAASAQAPRDPTGTWLTEDGRARVRVEKCPQDRSLICGTVVWLRDPLNERGQPRTDIHNPDPSKRSRPAIGMAILLGLRPGSEGRYEGEIYNSENGKKYDASVGVRSANALEVKGCVMGGLFCGGQTWTRVADVPAARPPQQTSQRTQ